MPLSLQCPQCNGSVSVAERAAGKRVKCPHCEQGFLAPGLVATHNDDDDWLKLDTDPKKPATSKPVASKRSPRLSSAASKSPQTATKNPSNASKNTAASNLNEDDEALLAEFATDLDEFAAETESPPSPQTMSPSTQPSAPLSSSDGGPMFTGTPASVQANPNPNPKPAPEAKPEFATQYRVKCKTCGTLLYAKATQAGQTVKCSDCHSPVTIPAPPRVRTPFSPSLETSPTFSLEESRGASPPPDPFKKSAKQLLDEAAREDHVEPKTVYDDTPSVKEWFQNVFGIFQDLGVIVHWIGLTLLGAIPAMIALSIDSDILALGLFPAGFFLGVLVVSCGFAILQAVANEEKSVTEWPTLDPMAWFGQLIVAVAAASLAAVPAWALCHFTIGPQLMGVAITMFAVYITFPFVLLSMLDMNTVMMPFSPEVARSVTKCEEAWGGFYFSSGLLFIGLFLTFAMASTMNPLLGAIVAIAAGIAITFCYFSMIGRLAYAIGQAVNAPPMKNAIDRTRPSDVT